MDASFTHDDALNTTRCSEQDIQELISYIDELEGELARKDEIIDHMSPEGVQHHSLNSKEDNDDNVLDLKKKVQHLLCEKEELEKTLERYVNEKFNSKESQSISSQSKTGTINPETYSFADQTAFQETKIQDNAVISITDQSSTDSSEESYESSESIDAGSKGRSNLGEEDDELNRKMGCLRLKEEACDHSLTSSQSGISHDFSSCNGSFVLDQNCGEPIQHIQANKNSPKNTNDANDVKNSVPEGKNKLYEAESSSSSSLKKALIDALNKLKDAEEQVAFYQRRDDYCLLENEVDHRKKGSGSMSCIGSASNKQPVKQQLSIPPLPPRGQSKSSPLVQLIRRNCCQGVIKLDMVQSTNMMVCSS